MSKDYFEVPVGLLISCPECNEEISHNYTQEDVLNNEYLKFTCECGYTANVNTEKLIEKAKADYIKELKKVFKTT